MEVRKRQKKAPPAPPRNKGGNQKGSGKNRKASDPFSSGGRENVKDSDRFKLYTESVTHDKRQSGPGRYSSQTASAGVKVGTTPYTSAPPSDDPFDLQFEYLKAQTRNDRVTFSSDYFWENILSQNANEIAENINKNKSQNLSTRASKPLSANYQSGKPPAKFKDFDEYRDYFGTFLVEEGISNLYKMMREMLKSGGA